MLHHGSNNTKKLKLCIGNDTRRKERGNNTKKLKQPSPMFQVTFYARNNTKKLKQGIDIEELEEW